MSVKKRFGAAVILVALAAWCSTIRAQQGKPGSPSSAPPGSTIGQLPLAKRLEAYLRHLYAWGPEVQLTFSPPTETPIPGLLETTVHLKSGENNESAKMYVSKDGKYLFRGEIAELSKDPLAEARSLIQLNDAPSMGDPKAPVTIVEFSDFECPVCRGLHDVVRTLLPQYPVRLVFKDFPIETIHPWARIAALAGRCAYRQDPKAFWKIYDLIYDNQAILSAENAWTKMNEFAGQAGLSADTFRGCLASPEAGAAVDSSRNNGQQLEVTSTPTVFVNGRRMVGADAHLLEQYIKYELGQQKAATANGKH